MEHENLNTEKTANSDLGDVSGSYSMQMEKLQKDLKEAEIKYVWGKDIHEQNRANLDMMTILNKIRKLKGID